MPKNYRQLANNVRSRINPEQIPFQKSFSEELSTISYSDVLTYTRLAMRGVEPEYTQRSRDAGERVKEHLQKNIEDIAFQYQGSVMTETHIKGHSDIDLLTICNKFYYWDSSAVNAEITNPGTRYFGVQMQKLQAEGKKSNYTGNSLEDLRKLRNDCEKTLRGIYNICDVSGAKSIRIRNQSLKREVDVVIANWFDDVNSIVNDRGKNRGIQVYNKEEHKQGKKDFPMVSIDRINERSTLTNGRLKRMIRFLKNVKADSELDIALSSFDFNAICYDLPVVRYERANFYELVPILYAQLQSITTDTNHANRLVSVDGREHIFRNNPSKLENVRKVLKEVEGVIADLKVVQR